MGRATTQHESGRTPHRRRAAWLAGALALAVSLVGASCQPITGAAGVPGAEGCPVTPPNAFWRADVRGLPVDSRSATWIASAGATAALKADFGSGLWDGGPIGIPYDVVAGTQPKVAVTFDYDDESDAGTGYPIPANPQIEGGTDGDGDRHILMVDKDNCILYELYDAHPNGDGTWHAGSGAIWSMRSNAMRPAGWTSADAAGLPILPGLVRYDEVASGVVAHAIRMTVPATADTYVWPASHKAGSRSAATHLPMGTWLRLKASVNPASFDPAIRPIVVALKTYGAVIADNGSAWYLSGAPDPRWNNDKLRGLATLKGSDFEALDATTERVAAGSYQGSTAQ